MFKGVWKSTEGATLPFVAMMIVVSLGLVGLAYDFGVQFLLLTELQKAADAAAIAGAYQLDTSSSDQDAAAVRVGEAVAGAAITANNTRMANLPGDVVIDNFRLLNSIPADDDALIDASREGPPYAYVEVTTAVSASNFSFLRIFGASATDTTATAVAGRVISVCDTTPIAVCNPLETAANPGAHFDPEDYIGHQIKGNTNIAGHDLSPGEIQWIQPANVGPGARDLAEALAAGEGTGSCIGEAGGVNLRPGTVASVRSALNTRFDIYENPFFGGSASRDPRFAPAENVTKGYDNSDPSSHHDHDDVDDDHDHDDEHHDDHDHDDEHHDDHDHDDEPDDDHDHNDQHHDDHAHHDHDDEDGDHDHDDFIEDDHEHEDEHHDDHDHDEEPDDDHDHDDAFDDDHDHDPAVCDSAPAAAPAPGATPTIMGLPRDTDISSDNRLGNGQWDCATYWQVNHPGRLAPQGCSSPASNSITRFEVYLYENNNNIIPNNSDDGGEDGHPVCSGAEPVQSNTSDEDEFQSDRRVVTVAVLNCLDQGLSNNNTDVEVEHFITGFLTEPSIDESANDSAIYIEIIGSSVAGQGGIAPVQSHVTVEIIR